MKSDAKLRSVVDEILVQMFEEADPPAKYPQDVKDYEDHYLESERQVEIVKEACKRHKLTKAERARVEFTVHMGMSPCTQQRVKSTQAQ